jgi:hypothetical protein
MQIPPLGPRGEGWTIIQVALMFAIIVAGGGPSVADGRSSLRRGAGILIAIGGVVMLAGGMVGLRHSLTPFPRPLERARLQVAAPTDSCAIRSTAG